MASDTYSTITTESVERLAHTLARGDIPVIERFEPVADFEELITFTTDNPTPLEHAYRNPVWRMQSVSARLTEAVAIAAHEPSIRDAGWEVLAQIILQHAEYLYTYHHSHNPRERLQAGAALALASSLCHALPQSNAWRLAGFARIAESIDKIDGFQSYLIEPIDAAYELAVALNLPIFGEAIDRYNTILNRNLQWNKRTHFKLSDQALFDHLDLRHPGLETVKTEWERGGLEEAKSAYVTAKHLSLHSKNWSALSLLLHRVIDSWESWFDRFPVPYVPDEERWRTGEAGRRTALEFPKVLIDRLTSVQNCDAMPFHMAKSCLEHARYLSAYHGLDDNGLHVETSGIGVAALLFPEWRDREQFLKLALRRYKWIHNNYILTDGLHTESSNVDSNLALTCLLSFYQFARLCDFRLPEDFDRRCEKIIESLMYLSQPDNRPPRWNRYSSAYLNVDELCGVGHAIFDRQDFLYMASKGVKGRPPNVTSHAFPYTGYYVMRNHWRTDAQYLVFDSSGLNSIRQREVKLNFLLYAFGRPLIVDARSFGPDAAAEDELHPSSGHNTVTIDGRKQCRPAMRHAEQGPNPDDFWLTTPSFDFVEGWHKDGYAEKDSPNCKSNLLHKRSIFYVKGKAQASKLQSGHSVSADGEYFILHDLVLGQGEHALEQIFHLASASSDSVEVRDNNVVRTVEPNLSNLVIAPVDAGDLAVRLRCRDTDAVVGSTASRNEIPPCDLTYATKRALPAVMNTILFPLRPRADTVPDLHPIEVVTDPDVLATGFAAVHHQATDLVLISDDGFARMSTTDIEFVGEYLFLRLDGEGQPQQVVIINGQFLTWGGDVLVELPEPRAHYESIAGGD
jgi:hypothetical protein